ncbi:uncharacterized protein LOC133183516 [Saccostrea echinata]|uniref:uncharacterized protein LOC133183516 n=1 Tax=Saccostrea echinata TaxID=191078 RepID=UPI002A7FC046|nr:uncharacterized protein LOC133183516 [Saccostrea echinata]
MKKFTEYLIFALILIIFACFIDLIDTAETCGSLLGTQLYCPSGYHCCDKTASTCCAYGYICGGTVCISIAAIIVPCIIVVVIIVVIIVIIVKKNKAHQGVVVSPGYPQSSGYPQPGQHPSHGQINPAGQYPPPPPGK